MTASMAQRMRMDVSHPNPVGRDRQLTGKAIRRHLCAALRRENPFIRLALAIQGLEIALIAGVKWLPVGTAVLASVHRDVVGLKIHVAPSQGAKLTSPQAMV